MSILSNLIKKAAPVVASAAPFTPIGIASASVATVQAQQDATYRRKLAEQQRRQAEMEFFGSSRSSIPTIQQNLAATTPVVSTASSGGSFLDTVHGGLREIGGFTQDLFSSGLPQIFGYNRPPSVRQQPAITSTGSVGAQESQGSGSIQAGGGAFLN